MTRTGTALVAAVVLAGSAVAARSQDTRTAVALPPMMREHMLANMRDHLLTLDRILADVAAERYAEAARLAEERLGMSSLRLHDAVHFAPYFPKNMQDAGSAMHRAASRLALAAGDADVDRSYQGLLKLTARLADLTATCTACHAAYRLASAGSGPERER